MGNDKVEEKTCLEKERNQTLTGTLADSRYTNPWLFWTGNCTEHSCQRNMSWRGRGGGETNTLGGMEKSNLIKTFSWANCKHSAKKVGDQNVKNSWGGNSKC